MNLAFLKTVNWAHKMGHILVGSSTGFAFALAHHPLTGFFTVTALALGKESGDYTHGETIPSCLFDLAITIGAGLLGILLHAL